MTDPVTPASASTRWSKALVSVVLVAVAGIAVAHDFKVGALVIDHPYALPTPGGVRNGAAYFRSISNTGAAPDRLIGASTPVATSVEFHRSKMDGNVMRMRAIDGIALPAGSDVKMRHDGELHLMLMGVKEPLTVGMRFPMVLRFEHTGELEVSVGVQKPSVRDAGHTH